MTDQALSSAVRDATYDWLDRLDGLISRADVPSRAMLADTEMVRLIVAWRALLEEHEPDEDGRCPRCSGWRGRRHAYRCSVWIAAHRHLVANDLAPSGARHALSDPCKEGT